jgi:2-polyprenyl-3-methyl-5-hydroxy-6-metoxy-1,4-benzoquinol methylase
MTSSPPLPEACLEFRCVICDSTEGRRTARTRRLEVMGCTRCGHQVAHHAPVDGTSDYHAQYDQGSFLESLRLTRTRQAQVLLGCINRHRPQAYSLLDFGSGRGWFLDAAREAGLRQLAGADTSVIAVELLRSRGIDGILLPTEGDAVAALEHLSFQPEVLTLLDVIEHFTPPTLLGSLERLVAKLRPELVVVKVPVSSGLLYRTAAVLAACGANGPLEQLYQVGTWPPHYHYFSRNSLTRALERCGLDLLEMRGDVDFEPATLASRARVLQRLPGLVTRGMGEGAAVMARSLALEDSAIVMARPRSR